MASKTSSIGIVASATLLLAGCPAELPPPELPAAEMPRVEMPRTPTPPGSARVVFDSPRERALVEQVVGFTHETDNEGHDDVIPVTQQLCVTPCVHDFSLGPKTLRLYSLTNDGHHSEFDLEVREPVVVRHVLEQNPSQVRLFLGAFSGALGLGGGVTGLVLIGDSIGSRHGHSYVADTSELQAGLGAAIGGVALGAASALAFIALRGEHRISATTIFPIPRQSSRTTSPGFGVRF